MDQHIDNMQKYANYKEQMERLKKALAHQFYLEAIFIENAIMEDRLESVLRHSGNWNPKPGTFPSLDSKRKKIAKMAEEKNSLANKYFQPELLEEIEVWKNDRNRMIHALMKQSIHTEDLREIAERGQTLVKTLCSKVSLYNRTLARREKEKEK